MTTTEAPKYEALQWGAGLERLDALTAGWLAEAWRRGHDSACEDHEPVCRRLHLNPYEEKR